MGERWASAVVESHLRIGVRRGSFLPHGTEPEGRRVRLLLPNGDPGAFFPAADPRSTSASCFWPKEPATMPEPTCSTPVFCMKSTSIGAFTST
jgi:hypothetical protein